MTTPALTGSEILALATQSLLLALSPLPTPKSVLVRRTGLSDHLFSLAAQGLAAQRLIQCRQNHQIREAEYWLTPK